MSIYTGMNGRDPQAAKTRMLNALVNGRRFTPAQARSWYKITNPRARVSELRSEGHNVRLVRTGSVRKNGSPVKVYTL